MLSAGASGLLNLVAIAGPNGQILLQQRPAVRLYLVPCNILQATPRAGCSSQPQQQKLPVIVPNSCSWRLLVCRTESVFCRLLCTDGQVRVGLMRAVTAEPGGIGPCRRARPAGSGRRVCMQADASGALVKVSHSALPDTAPRPGGRVHSDSNDRRPYRRGVPISIFQPDDLGSGRLIDHSEGSAGRHRGLPPL